MFSTNGFSIKPLKVKLLAGKQKVTVVLAMLCILFGELHEFGGNASERAMIRILISGFGFLVKPKCGVVDPLPDVACVSSLLHFRYSIIVPFKDDFLRRSKPDQELTMLLWFCLGQQVEGLV